MNQELKLQEGIEHYRRSLDQLKAARIHLAQVQKASEQANLELGRLIAASGRHAVVLGDQRFYIVGENELVVEEFKDLVLAAKTSEEQ